MKPSSILKPSLATGIIALSIIMCPIVNRPLYAYDTPVKIGPDFLEVNEGDGVEEPDNSDETNDPPLRGDYSIGGNVHYKMAMNSLTAQHFKVRNGAQVELWAPKILLKPGFHAKPNNGDGYFRAGIPVFDVNCINLVDPNPLTEYNGLFTDLPSTVTVNGIPYANFFDVDGDDQEGFREFCENEIVILNHHFVNKLGGQLIRFRLKNTVEWQWDLTTPATTMLTIEDKNLYYCLNTGDSTGATMVTSGGPCSDTSDLFNDSSFADSSALTIIYYRYPNDSSNKSSGTANTDGAPYVLINYNRSDTTWVVPDSGDVNGNGLGNGIMDDDKGRKGVQEHEMAHGFWLQHTWDERVTSSTSPPSNQSNIMNYGGSSDDSVENKKGYDKAGNLLLWGNRETEVTAFG